MPANADDFLEYAQRGVDPTLASRDTDFVGSLTTKNPEYYAPQATGPRRGGSLFQSDDMALSMASSNLNSVSNVVKNLSMSIERLMGVIQQNSAMSSTSISALASLQMQAQQRISSQQMPMQFAQYANPGAYRMAPGLEYQTNPSMAAFRNSTGYGMTGYGFRPGSSLTNDVVMTTPWLRNFMYEPSMAEDPYMSRLNASSRMQERWNTVANSAGTVGSQTAGAGIGWKAATMLAGRVGLGAIATPLAIGDMALDMFGLPSISGTVQKGAEAIYGATAGRYFNNLDMTRDIQRSTRFLTGSAAGLGGQGLSMARSAKVVSGLNKMQSSDWVMNQKDYFGMFTAASDNGLLNMSGNEDQMLKSVQGVSKNLRLFMRITGDPDYKNAIRMMGDLYKMGIPQGDLGAAASNISNFSRMAGLSMDQASKFGSQGAMIYQQAGANMGIGYQTGIMNRALTRSAVQAGMYSPGVLANLGGEEGVSQRLTEASGAFMAGPMGGLMSAGFLTSNGKGGYAIDQNKIAAFSGGKTNIESLVGQGHGILGQRGATEYFMTHRQQIMDSLSQQLGPQGQAMAQLQTIKYIMGKTGLGYRGAAQASGMSAENALAFTSTYNSTNLPSFFEAQRTSQGMQEVNRLEVVRSGEMLWNRAIVGMKEGWQENVGFRIDRASAEHARRQEAEDQAAMGIVGNTSRFNEASLRSLANLPSDQKARLLKGSGGKSLWAGTGADVGVNWDLKKKYAKAFAAVEGEGAMDMLSGLNYGKGAEYNKNIMVSKYMALIDPTGALKGKEREDLEVIARKTAIGILRGSDTVLGNKIANQVEGYQYEKDQRTLRSLTRTTAIDEYSSGNSRLLSEKLAGFDDKTLGMLAFQSQLSSGKAQEGYVSKLRANLRVKNPNMSEAGISKEVDKYRKMAENNKEGMGFIMNLRDKRGIISAEEYAGTVSKWEYSDLQRTIALGNKPELGIELEAAIASGKGMKEVVGKIKALGKTFVSGTGPAIDQEKNMLALVEQLSKGSDVGEAAGQAGMGNATYESMTVTLLGRIAKNTDTEANRKAMSTLQVAGTTQVAPEKPGTQGQTLTVKQLQ